MHRNWMSIWTSGQVNWLYQCIIYYLWLLIWFYQGYIYFRRSHPNVFYKNDFFEKFYNIHSNDGVLDHKLRSATLL